MATEEEIRELYGRQVLVKSAALDVASGNPIPTANCWYYVGTVEMTTVDSFEAVMVRFSKMYCVAYSHRMPKFTSRTGIMIRPKCPGFFKFPYNRLDPCPDPSFLRLDGIEILEINKEESK